MTLILRKELNKESLMYPNNLLKTINALPGIIDISSTPLYDKGWSSFIIFFTARTVAIDWPCTCAVA